MARDADNARRSRIVTLSAAAHVRLLGRLAAAGTAGVRTYDAVIAECARQSKVDALLTLNPRHVDPATRGVVVVVPPDTA